jgi:Plasmid pRiA4b ORF-3-like protein
MTYVDRIARLRVALDDIEPAIWRTVEVPLTMTLKGLHEVIQAVMPFEDYHLFAFRIEGQRYALPDLEWPDPKTRNARTTKLGTVLEAGVKTFAYIYDFGDNWQHTVSVEAIGPADPTAEYGRVPGGGVARR